MSLGSRSRLPHKKRPTTAVCWLAGPIPEHRLPKAPAFGEGSHAALLSVHGWAELLSHAGLWRRLGEAGCEGAWPLSKGGEGHGRLVTHSGTSCCPSGAGSLHCCNPVRSNFRPAEPGSSSSSGGTGEHCFSGGSGLAEEPTTSGEPGFPKEPGSRLEGFSPFPEDCLPRGLWSLPLARDIRLRRPTESSSLAASFFISGFSGAVGGGGGGSLGPGAVFCSQLLPELRG